jgi:hypothetical protein
MWKYGNVEMRAAVKGERVIKKPPARAGGYHLY